MSTEGKSRISETISTTPTLESGEVPYGSGSSGRDTMRSQSIGAAHPNVSLTRWLPQKVMRFGLDRVPPDVAIRLIRLRMLPSLLFRARCHSMEMATDMVLLTTKLDSLECVGLSDPIRAVVGLFPRGYYTKSPWQFLHSPSGPSMM